MAVVAELHRLSGLAMRSVIDHLWPKGPKPDNYFGLVQQFLGVVSRIEAMKRSACIEGARMALARVKTYWADMGGHHHCNPESDRKPGSSGALF